MTWPDPDIQIGGDGTTEAWRILLRSVLRMVGYYFLSYVSTLFRVHFNFCVQSNCRTSKLVQSSCCSEGSYLIFMIKEAVITAHLGNIDLHECWSNAALSHCSLISLVGSERSTQIILLLLCMWKTHNFFLRNGCITEEERKLLFFKLLLYDYQCHSLTSYLSVHPPFYEARVILNTIMLVISIYRADKLLRDERVYKGMPITRIIYHFLEHLGLGEHVFLHITLLCRQKYALCSRHGKLIVLNQKLDHLFYHWSYRFYSDSCFVLFF